MERFEFYCPVHGIVGSRRHMDIRLDASKCTKCDRTLRFALEGDARQHVASDAS
jgi:hypothetical protein